MSIEGHNPEIVNYKSKAFNDGYAAGQSHLTPIVPDDYMANEVDRASWLEGWLMGDEESR